MARSFSNRLSNKFLTQHLAPGQAPVPGVRAQICVTDYNDNGRLDLIVGDFSEIHWTRELNAEEQAEYDELVDEIMRLSEKLGELGYDDENRELRIETLNQYLERQNRKKSFYLESRYASFIWLYLRQDTEDEEVDNAGGDRSDASARPTDTKPDEQPADDARSGPVSAEVRLRRALADTGDENQGEWILSVNISIQAGWHLYAPGGPAGIGIPTDVTLELPDGVRAIGQWNRPPSEPDMTNPTQRIYSGNVVWTRKLHASKPPGSDSSIEVHVRFQACTDVLCLPPETLNKSAPWPSDR